MGRGWRSGWGVRVDVNKELKFLRKFTKQNWGGGGRGCSGWRVFGLGGVRSRGGCERRIEVFVKIQKIKFGGGGGWGVGLGVRVDVNEELKFLGKFTKKSGGGGIGEVYL